MIEQMKLMDGRKSNTKNEPLLGDNVIKCCPNLCFVFAVMLTGTPILHTPMSHLLNIIVPIPYLWSNLYLFVPTMSVLQLHPGSNLICNSVAPKVIP